MVLLQYLLRDVGSTQHHELISRIAVPPTSVRGRSLFIESDSNKIYFIVATQFEQQTNLLIIITWNILPEKRSIATQINSRLSFWNFGHDINNRCQAWPSDTLCGVWLFWSPTKIYMAILQYNSATRTAMLISAGKTISVGQDNTNTIYLMPVLTIDCQPYVLVNVAGHLLPYT